MWPQYQIPERQLRMMFVNHSHAYTHMHVYRDTYMYKYVHPCIHACMHACMYICIYIYIEREREIEMDRLFRPVSVIT